ncbi:MAG: benzoyl-CoA reductase subunit D [Deltaproteobacteria bacterium]|nr:benzoyl-CoA reductase subunit D [Deltaproteobacteria bacterium]
MNGTKLHTGGVDVGTSSIKVALFRVGEGEETLLAKVHERIRRRDPKDVARRCFEHALDDAGLQESEVAYVASTGEGSMVEFRRGHFYGMTTHARGGLFLVPDAHGVLDVGALHARAIRIDDRAKVLGHRMTSQCASGSGQFIENIARYLGVTIDEVGDLSLASKNPEKPSGICAVLAETDVINMVSRGIARNDILKGIHLSMADRLIRLLRSADIQEKVVMTGGLSKDEGLRAAVIEGIAKDRRVACEVVTHEDAIYAGAIGAALWGAVRHRTLERRKAETQAQSTAASPA